MKKAEVAAELKCSPRSVENYVRRGLLSVRYEKGATSDVAVFNPEEVRRLKAAQSSKTALVPAVVHDTPERPEGEARKPESLALVPARADRPGRVELLTLNVTDKLLLTVREAALVSGLSARHLYESCATGQIRARKIGRGWKVRPEDLRDYVNTLFG